METYIGRPSWQALDVADDQLPDGEIANHTMEVLEEIKGQQFFSCFRILQTAYAFQRPNQIL